MFKRSLLLLILVSQAAFGQSAQPLFDRFTKLRDAPHSYAGQSGKAVTVKTTEDGLEFTTGGGGGSGTVTTFSAGNLSPLFTTSVSNATTTPALSFSLSTAGAHSFLGNNTGGVAAPAYVQPAFTDLSGSATDSQIPNILTLTGISNLTSNGFVKTGAGIGTLSTDTNTYLTGNQTITISGDASGSGTTAITLALSNIPDLTTQAGSILATNITAPTSPAAGKNKLYFDSTSKNIAAKNDAGTVNHGIQTRTATGSNWIRSIADDGTTIISQPAFSDVSGSVDLGGAQASGTLAAGRFPALTGDVTTGAGSLATTLVNIPNLTTQAGSILATNIAAPTAPAAGKNKLYFDSTSKNIAAKNDVGNINHGVQTKTFTAGVYISSIADDGSVGTSTVDFTDLTGTATDAQIPDILTVTKISNLTTNGFVQTSAGDGTLLVSKPVGRVASITSIVDQTAAAEQAHVTYTVPANTVAAGTVFRITAAGNMDNGTTAVTFTPRIRWGGTAGVQITAVPTVVGTTTAQTTKTWRYEGTVTIRSIGASGVCYSETDLSNHTASATGVFAEESTNPNATATIDTTVNKDLVFTWTLSVITGTPHVRTHMAVIEQL